MAKVKVLNEIKVIADISRALSYSRDMEHYAKQAESLVREFNDFVRDHRSMDWAHLNVEREYEEQCSHCHGVLDTYANGEPACCDAAIDEFESTKENIKKYQDYLDKTDIEIAQINDETV